MILIKEFGIIGVAGTLVEGDDINMMEIRRESVSVIEKQVSSGHGHERHRTKNPRLFFAGEYKMHLEDVMDECLLILYKCC